MGVYERGDSPYYWMFNEVTKKKSSTGILIGVTATERKEARKLAEAGYRVAMLRAGGIQAGVLVEPVETTCPTFNAFAEWYVVHEIPRHGGAEREREILPRLRAAFGTLPLDQIVPKVVSEWQTQRLTTPTVIAHFGGPNGPKRTIKPPGPRTVNRETDLLQMILEAAVPTYVPVSPLRDFEDLTWTKPLRRTMSASEEAKIAAHLNNTDRALFYVALDALVRMGDVLDLKWTDDLGTKLQLHESKNRTAYEVPISKRMRTALDAVPVDPEAPEYIFSARRGAKTARDRRHGVAHALRRACEAAGVAYGRAAKGLTFHHATRRTGTTRMLQHLGEKSLGVVAKLGNWKDVRMLFDYQEVSDAQMREAVESVAPPKRQVVRLMKKRKQA